MLNSKTFRIKNYELTCSARASESGGFEPALVIAKRDWPARPCKIKTRHGAHSTAQTAIEAALSQGIEWIINFG
jgi:hypothetical protein